MHVKWSKNKKRCYRKAQEEYLSIYSRIDYILYNMCKKWPDHKNREKVHAKVRIIGRVYGAGLERTGRDQSKGIYETIAKVLYKNRKWIDESIKDLRKIKNPKSAEREILSLHGKLLRLIRKGTKSGLNYRSFVSKYLHFHIPIVPIFDSLASKNINSSVWYPWKRWSKEIYKTIKWEEKYDWSYFKFFGQFILYFSDIKEQRLKPSSVKNADYYLTYWDHYR
jgi:hypothetical protein